MQWSVHHHCYGLSPYLRPTKYTPVDTLVFGGNFLHSYNIATRKRCTISTITDNFDIEATELKVRDIEIATHVPKKFRFPYFVKYVAIYVLLMQC